MSLSSTVVPLLQTISATSPVPFTSTMPTMTTEGGPPPPFATSLDELKLQFGFVDYSMFVAMMLMSALIGVYYGFFKKQDTVSEYLLGGQTMGVFPIAMSLIASNVSGITMLGVPAEMYNFGSQFFILAIFAIPGMVLVMYWFMPMFYDLQYTSSYEYLEHRFDRKVRHLISVLFTIGMILYMPVVIYVPCLALNQVTGISVHVISPIACLVCIFYTSLGGLKAVVWTDALQMVILTLASIFVIILGIIRLGGIGVVYERSLEGNRIELFNMDPSLYARNSFWIMLFTSILIVCGNMGTNPTSVQRYLCVPDVKAARRVVAVLALGYVVTKLLSCVTGLIIYATYYYCDPLEAKVVNKPDQLVPYYVMDIARDWPGLSGLFVAGVFSAALSTMSAVLNTLSGTLYKDFIEAWLPGKVSEARASFIMKMLSLGLGAFCVCMIFFVERLGGVLQVAVSLGGITAGAMFGLFFLGMFIPWANTKGAMAGGVGSLIFMAWTVVGNSLAQTRGDLKYYPLPVRTDGCLNGTVVDTLDFLNATIPDLGNHGLSTSALPSVTTEEGLFPLYRISYYLFGILGCVVCIVIGSVVSLLTGPTDPATIDPKFISPAIRGFLPKRRYVVNQRAPKDEYIMVNTKPTT